MRSSIAAFAELLKKEVRPRKAAVEITDAAAVRLRQMLEERHKNYLKFGVRKRGCSGLSYTLNYADEKGRLDELVEEKGVRILIDASALLHVLGTRIDFHEDPLRSEFVFQNPKAKGTCGCGESFTT